MPGNSIEVPEELHDRIFVGIPLLCNADSVDMEVFLEQHWAQPVTAQNSGDLSRAFVKWFKAVAPTEYADPHEVMAARGWGGARSSSGPKTLKPLKAVRLTEVAALRLAAITAYQRDVRGQPGLSQGAVLAELITAYHLEMEAATEDA